MKFPVDLYISLWCIKLCQFFLPHILLNMKGSNSFQMIYYLKMLYCSLL